VSAPAAQTAPEARALSAAEVARFRAEGWLGIERITSEGELALLRGLYDRILADPRTFSLRFDGGGVLQQVMSPDLLYAEMRDTACFRNARRLACQLLGIREDELAGFFTHMIFKPAGDGRDVPWHQDEAYWDQPRTRAHSLSVWIPLDPVGVEGGCLQFLPGSHQGDVLRHRPQPNGEPIVLDDPSVDLGAAVACPLPAGGASFHHCRTLHYSAPNRSGVQRRAWSIAFHAPPEPRAEPLARPWLAGFAPRGGRL
jgi:hypothetical protein